MRPGSIRRTIRGLRVIQLLAMNPLLGRQSGVQRTDMFPLETRISPARSPRLSAALRLSRQADPAVGGRASFSTIKRRPQITARTIIRWKQRFLHSGLDRLDTYHPRLRRTVVMRVLRARILSATRKKPHDVHRVWKEAGLKPHRLERSWKLSHTLVLRPTVLFQVRGKISVDSALYRLIMNII
jgi:hypothetical protein